MQGSTTKKEWTEREQQHEAGEVESNSNKINTHSIWVCFYIKKSKNGYGKKPFGQRKVK